MINVPNLKLGLVSVSRDCFPISLSAARRDEIKKCAAAENLDIFFADTIIENEKDAIKALGEINAAGVNALVMYLGNFGPEGPETIIAQKFDGPVMFVAAAEESGNSMFDGRGDAYCGMLNASYNLGLRGIKAYIPEYPVATPDGIVKMIKDFAPVAKIYVGLHGLKIFSFGPRPYDFLACNAPIAPLYKIGVEIQENSELDLFEAFNKHENDPRIPALIEEMAQDLGVSGNKYPGILPKLAQYEITLLDWAEENIGASRYFVFANKCWPAFQTQFGFVPCYVNSRLAARGIPVACETDIYGALSEYIITCATDMPATLLDINNSVPADMFRENKEFGGYTLTDTFMGFHCGNTAGSCLASAAMSYQRIMKRSLEPDGEPNITRGTLEGNLRAGEATIFRLQSTADAELRSYVAEGEILNVDCKSFGSIGVFAIPEMGRFYRHVLIAKRYPHHAGIAFKHAGKALFAAMKLLGVEDVAFNQPKGMLYKDENPFG